MEVIFQKIIISQKFYAQSYLRVKAKSRCFDCSKKVVAVALKASITITINRDYVPFCLENYLYKKLMTL